MIEIETASIFGRCFFVVKFKMFLKKAAFLAE